MTALPGRVLPGSSHGARPACEGRGSVVFSAAAVLLLVVWACRPEGRPLVLASTTSTEDSGLFDELLPAFEAEVAGQLVRLVSVGSGEALRLGERGDADVLLVHSPAAEAEFMRAGHGLERRAVMYNEFVLVGPAADPAAAAGSDIRSALRAIAAAGARFVSRGDDSGTHRKELALWQEAGVAARGATWYMDVGQGMGETLTIAAERGAYTLSDLATFTAIGHTDGLTVLVRGDPVLHNPYSVISARRAHNLDGARAFMDWITGPRGQRLIGRYGVQRFGRALFTPAADPGAAD